MVSEHNVRVSPHIAASEFVLKSSLNCQLDNEKLAHYAMLGESSFDGSLDRDELAHYGVLGMHWGVRRYQNKDGTLTDAGKKRQSESGKDSNDAERKKKLKKAVAIGAAVVGASLAVYGTYKYTKFKSVNHQRAKELAEALIDGSRTWWGPSDIKMIKKFAPEFVTSEFLSYFSGPFS